MDPQELSARLAATHLAEAARAGDLERVRALLDLGVPVDHRFGHADTALALAVGGGHVDVVDLLLARGADPKRIDRRGASILLAAWNADSLVIAHRLLEAGARPVAKEIAVNRGLSLLARAIAADRQDWIGLLLAYDVKLASEEANRLLAGALSEASSRRLEKMELLLSLGADPSYRPGASGSPLVIIAISAKDLAGVDLLLAHGASIEETDALTGRSALFLAAQAGEVATVQWLLARGASVDARAKDGTTPLFEPLARRDDALATILIEAGARVDVASVQGRTPLMVRAALRPRQRGENEPDIAQRKMIELLIARGSDVDAVDVRGESAASLAGKACSFHALSTLAQHGATIELEAWIDILQAPCTPRWAQALDELRAEFELPLPSLAVLEQGPLAPLDPRDEDAQRRTLQEMRHVGSALMSWLTDRVSWSGGEASIRFAEHSGQEDLGMDVSKLPALSAEQLAEMLRPFYLANVPDVDGWGFRYDYRIATSLLGSSPVLMIRSPGADGRFDAKQYPDPRLPKGLFPPAQAHRDIVWIDGRFVQAPRLRRLASSSATPARSPRPAE